MSTTTPTPSAEATQPQSAKASVTDLAGCCGRRTVLRAVGLVALSGSTLTLAACSTGTSTAQGSESTPESTAVPISEVVVGGGVVVDEKYVVTQPTDGEFKAFSAICTHQGCPVGSVEGGVIICPCHKSHFDITSGDPVQGPAQEPLPAVKFTKSGDTIYVTG